MRIIAFRLGHLKPGPRPKGGESVGPILNLFRASCFVLRIYNSF